MKPNDVSIPQIEDDDLVLRSDHASDRLAPLVSIGEYEYRAGRTKNLRAFAAEEGIDLDDDAALRG